MCFEINRHSNYAPIPTQMRSTPHQGFVEPKITCSGWEYDSDQVYNQQDGAILAATLRRFSGGPAGYEQSHDVSYNHRGTKITVPSPRASLYLVEKKTKSDPSCRLSRDPVGTGSKRSQVEIGTSLRPGARSRVWGRRTLGITRSEAFSAAC